MTPQRGTTSPEWEGFPEEGEGLGCESAFPGGISRGSRRWEAQGGREEGMVERLEGGQGGRLWP